MTTTKATADHLPDSGTRAILFDCDGTLVETMHIHRIVWGEIFERYGFTITDEWWAQWANVALVPYVQAAIPGATAELADQLNAESMEVFNRSLHLAEPLEHVIEVAREYHGKLPLAVVTGGYRDVIIPTLDAAGITHLFDHIVTADDVANSKPAPDLYRLAMERIGVAAADCLVYEDSEIGMAAANGALAGRVVDIRTWPTL